MFTVQLASLYLSIFAFYLCSNGSAALIWTCVKVEVKQVAGVGHIQVLVCIQAGFQTLKTSKNHQKVPKERLGGIVTNRQDVNTNYYRRLTLKFACKHADFKAHGRLT